MTIAASSAPPLEIVRPSTSRDIPGLQRLFRDVFGQERDEALWRWKYFENPRGCASYVCEAGGEIVVHCGGTRVTIHDGARRYDAFQSVDFMSSARYPGGAGRGGVFVRTTTAFFADYCGPDRVPMVYGFPGERHRVLGERLLGYRRVEPVAEFSLPTAGQGGHAIPLEESHLPLFTAPPPGATIFAERDATYLRWRYLAHPAHRYHLVSPQGRFGSAAAAIVLLEGEEARVMELGGDLSDAPLAGLSLELRRLGRPVHLWSSAEGEIAVRLRRAGFSVEPRDHFVECRFFFDRAVPDPGTFYFSMGDYDVY